MLNAYDADNNNESIAAKYPRSAAIKRIRITLLPPTSDEFKSAIDKYTQRQIVKGVPSLGSDLSSLYLMEDKTTNNRFKLATDPVDVKSHAVYR